MENMFKTLSIIKNHRKNKKFHLKKNLSTLSTISRFNNSKYNTFTSNINNTNSKNKNPIALFIENNPYHYKLPSLNKSKKVNMKILSERNFFNKRLMDSIENFSKKKNLNSEQYDSNISNLMTKYIYSNPDADTNIDKNYELTRTKIKFFNERKKKILNIMKKSKSVFKFTSSETKYEEGENEKNAMINIINVEYKDPIDSLGLVLRNKIVHDKILLNYQDRQVQDFGKKIKFFDDLNKNEIFSKKVKITSIIPSMIDNNMYNPSYHRAFSDSNKIINPYETNVNIFVQQILYLKVERNFAWTLIL